MPKFSDFSYEGISRQRRINMKTVRIFAFVISLALVLGAALTLPVSANSAQTKWNGTDAAGASVTDGDCPIIVEKEILTLDLAEFPQTYYHSSDDYLAYTGRVTAEYHFYNPSDYTVTATLLFPFGKAPDYGMSYDENGMPIRDVDVQKYGIKVNGEQIDAELRHSILENYQVLDFLNERYLPVEDEYHRHPSYTPELAVVACTYTVSGVNDNAYPAATAAIDLPENGIQNGNAMLYIPDQRCLQSNDGIRRVGVGVDNGESFTVYIIGSLSADLPKWTVYQNGGVDDGEEIGGNVTLTKTEEMTFLDLALTKWDAEGGVDRIDWYNAFTRQLFNARHSFGLVDPHYMRLDVGNQLNRWYKYEITLEPGERMINTVTAPIYPDINGRFEPPTYAYTYLLSPAKTWKEFGNIDIRINTPFYLLDNSLGDFEKTSEGYALHLESLPQWSELEFTLCASESPERQTAPLGLYLIFLMLSPFVLIGMIILILVAVIVTVILIKRRKRKKQENDAFK